MSKEWELEGLLWPCPGQTKGQLSLIWSHREGRFLQEAVPRTQRVEDLLIFAVSQGRGPWVKFKTVGPWQRLHLSTSGLRAPPHGLTRSGRSLNLPSRPGEGRPPSHDRQGLSIPVSSPDPLGTEPQEGLLTCLGLTPAPAVVLLVCNKRLQN